jgi:hypothetical protein
MDIRNKKTLHIAKGGFFTAIGFIFVYLSTIVPVNKAYLLAMASFIIPLSVITTNVRNTIVVYMATSLLAIVICGAKITIVLYIIFFGLYGLVKYYIELLRKLYLELVLKLLFLNIDLAILFFVYKLFFPGLLKIAMPLYIIIAATQIAFLVFDYILTMFITYSNKHFIKKLNL